LPAPRSTVLRLYVAQRFLAAYSHFANIPAPHLIGFDYPRPSGELRAVSQLDTRLKEALKLGFRRCVIPQSTRKRGLQIPNGLEAIGCRSLREAVDVSLLPK
jgi:DNA repair protein RadA/Sms